MRDGQKTRFARRLRRNMTPAERLLWWKLKEKQQGWKFLRQTPVRPFVVDFACLEVLLAIEVDGASHSTKDELDYDASRTLYLESQGWRVVRFWNREIRKPERCRRHDPQRCLGTRAMVGATGPVPLRLAPIPASPYFPRKRGKS